MEFNENELRIISSALRVLENDSRSDEPHISHSDTFIELRKKINKFLTN